MVMVRVNDDALARMDQLVEADLFGSRSECAAFLIGAGIASQKELFDRLSAHTEEIRKLKEQLRQVAMDALKPTRTGLFTNRSRIGDCSFLCNGLQWERSRCRGAAIDCLHPPPAPARHALPLARPTC